MGLTEDAVVGPPAMRIGDAERDECVEVLAEHHVRGRLTVDELDRRQRAALTASTEDELAALLVDLPDGHAPAVADTRTSRLSLLDRLRASRVARTLVLAPASLAAGGGLVAVTDTSDDVWKFVLGLTAAAAGFAASEATRPRRTAESLRARREAGQRSRHDSPTRDTPR